MAKKALLFVNSNKNEARVLAASITSVLAKRGWEAAAYSLKNKENGCAAADCDIGFSLGGDGTVLYAARALAPRGIPLLPVNLGTLGFISSVPPDAWERTFAAWEAGQAAVSKRLMLEVSVERGGGRIFHNYCLNDAVISASGIAKLIRLEVGTETGGGEPISLGRFRADGLIVATPTGSTGYSVAAGGPIIDPEMDAVIINPICPFTLSNRPMVLPADERVSVLVEDDQRSDVLLTVDGQITEALRMRDRIHLRRPAFPASLIACNRGVFYRALRTKLGWSGGTSHASYSGGSDA
ncbi:MAG: NAD(+)/NADH kinase [Treponema sp.]|jgi:NAD+ kinase|nr:NAD(+)/NADH kinase [Treponema sp.]